MTAAAESEKCGIASLFVMSCRGRAEAFARRLQSRLSSLNKEEEAEEPNENTWLATSEPIAVSQPRHKEQLELNPKTECLDDNFPTQNDDDEITLEMNLTRCERVCHLSLSDCSSDETDEEVSTVDINISASSTEYCTCPEELSRTLTEDSFTSLESDNVNEDYDQIKIHHEENSYYIPVVEENMKNEEKTSSKDEEKLCSEIIEDFCEKHCDIFNVDEDKTDNLSSLEDSLTKTDLLNILNTETSAIQNGGYHDEEITPLRRCSSLRTGKTPPGTPGRKKIVRFADVLGLDLADVRTFLDEIPKIPNSAYIDLQGANLTCSSYHDSPEKILIPLFTQPGGLSDFLQRVHDNKVCLENALVEDVALMSVKGTVRVLNLDFHKTVHIRYSVDGWKTFSDLQCSYVVNSCDGFSDKFTFLVYANMLKVGERLEFAIRYQCRNCFFWDNNNRCNYSFQCLPTTSSMPYTPITTEEPWGTAFYYEDDATTEAEERHRHLAVQEYIAATLDKHKRIDSAYSDIKKKPNVVTVFLIVIISIIFLYVQRAVYFT